ncbi:MAG TPA: serine--tRNA ligase [Phycisphaerales bacterium]|nr:serine--tRNA ligase [Phycisphaerales bacterium]HMP37142.1 serine--tRNA ligase [Phycisphaerales bacterium]
MIDLKQLRDDPEHFKRGARDKAFDVDVEALVRLDERRRLLITDLESRRAEQNRVSKEVGPEIGRLKGRLKSAAGDDRDRLEAEIRALEHRPAALKTEIQAFERQLAELQRPFEELWLAVPQPPAPDVPRGSDASANVEARRWSPPTFDPAIPFAAQRGFAPKTHLELVRDLGLVDFERAVRMSGTRHYVLVGAGMRLHQAVLRYALDTMIDRHGFTPVSVPVIVREECMVGTGFFPTGREQAYHIEESRRGAGADLFLTGTGEVGLMGLHADEILDGATLPRRYVTVSTCFRREAGAAGKDTAGLYRIHQFDKVEQVVICRADDSEQRDWHRAMIGYVEEILRSLSLPHRLLECCTGDLGLKNEAMVDIECWMPGRGAEGPDGKPVGDWGETHSASRLGDYQCRRLNLRYRDEAGRTVICWSLNNTVIASPRILIPLLEIHQDAEGGVVIPAPLRPYMGGLERIAPPTR